MEETCFAYFAIYEQEFVCFCLRLGWILIGFDRALEQVDRLLIESDKMEFYC